MKQSVGKSTFWNHRSEQQRAGTMGCNIGHMNSYVDSFALFIGSMFPSIQFSSKTQLEVSCFQVGGSSRKLKSQAQVTSSSHKLKSQAQDMQCRNPPFDPTWSPRVPRIFLRSFRDPTWSPRVPRIFLRSFRVFPEDLFRGLLRSFVPEDLFRGLLRSF